MSASPYKITPFRPSPDLLKTPPNASDFIRQDESPDTSFYSTPRFVTHIDDGAIAALRTYFGANLPQRASGAKPPRILDFCSSWISHYPPSVESAAAAGDVKVVGLGMSAPELARNALLESGGRVVRDLNDHPEVSAKDLGLGEGEKLDALTCTVSIDYLTSPIQVLSSLRRLTRKDGLVHLAISNRCFPTKAVRRWLHADEETRLRFCCEDLWRAGWRDVEVVEVTSGVPEQAQSEQGGQLARLMASMGMRMGGDPLWVVRGTNTGEP